jgi:quinol monooxygenase YgiN
MGQFGQQTRLVATPGQRDALVAKFLQSAEIQRENQACKLMIVGTSATENDVVYLMEIWASEAEWERARTSDEVTVWAEGMSGLVAFPPESIWFDPAGGKGLPSST